MKQKSDYGLVFWIHLVIIIFVWISLFIIDWKIILFFILLFYLQLLVFKDCVLSKKQFGSKPRKMTFYGFVLQKIGIKVNRRKFHIFLDYIFPWIILGVAILWQIVLGE